MQAGDLPHDSAACDKEPRAAQGARQVGVLPPCPSTGSPWGGRASFPQECGPPLELPVDIGPWAGPLLFQKGNLVECRSFLEGFKDAWFRSKVLDTRVDVERGGCQEYLLAFCDFADEKPDWIALQQVNPAARDQLELMIRPRPPQHLPSPGLAEHRGSSPWTLAFLMERGWAVGDEVEGFIHSCWWRGTIAKIKEGGRVLAKWRDPPFGEGGQDVVPFSGLRPILQWEGGRWSARPLARGPVGRLLQLANPAVYYTVQTPDISETSRSDREGRSTKPADGVGLGALQKGAAGGKCLLWGRGVEKVRSRKDWLRRELIAARRKKRKTRRLPALMAMAGREGVEVLKSEAAESAQVLKAAEELGGQVAADASANLQASKVATDGAVVAAMEPAVRKFVAERCEVSEVESEFLSELLRAYVEASGDAATTARHLARCLKGLGFQRKQKRVPVKADLPGLLPGSVQAAISGLRLKAKCSVGKELKDDADVSTGQPDAMEEWVEQEEWVEVFDGGPTEAGDEGWGMEKDAEPQC